ncbi:two-component sensor histidine kinase [Bacillus sp. B-jedd]|nr:two-component sensor histidine kinase [Bacillus sp. B-jedd]
MIAALRKGMNRVGDMVHQSIRIKLSLFFIVVALVPLAIFGFVSFQKSSSIVNRQFNEYEQFAVSQLERQLEDTIDQMYVVSKDIHHYLSDPTLIVIKEEIPKTYEGFIEKKNFERFLEAHKTFNTKGIYLITKSGYYYGDRNLDIKNLTRQPFWKEASRLKQGEHWIGFYKGNHYESKNRDKPGQIVGLVVPIQSQYGILKGSKLLIETDATELFSYIRFLERDVDSFVTIRDSQNKILYETKGRSATKGNDIVRKTEIEAYGWQVEVRVPEKIFYQSSNVILKYTILAICFSILLAILLAMAFSAPVAKRIKLLKRSMEKVSAGQLATRAPITGRDEISVLTTSFNQMVGQISGLINDMSRTEREKRQAELRAFHYQINPHLLFNTLNSIQWKARLAKADEVQEMIYHLTEVLHENLKFTDELILLQKELDTISHYLKVQEIRYGHMFDYKQNVEPGCEAYLIPRLSLQPLFENIFFHAFEDGKGTIILTVEAEAEELLMTLVDNGKGMNEGKVQGLLDGPTGAGGKKENSGGIGVYNVDQRLKLHFGSGYGLSIESSPGAGTTIKMRWPKRGPADLHD